MLYVLNVKSIVHWPVWPVWNDFVNDRPGTNNDSKVNFLTGPKAAGG